MAKKKPKTNAVPRLRLEWLSPAELAENPANWRRHPEGQRAALEGILDEVGWAGACLYNERTRRLVDGHLRRKVGKARGDDKIPVLIGNWTEESLFNGGDDWTVVRVKGDTAAWGFLELADVTVKVKDYVNIIQHPYGLPKQIALYHNIVAFADDNRVQYLTDTDRGSSGSPVFDSNWNVVALHHRGGDLPEPGSGGATYFRNQGIHVRALLKGLAKHGLPTK
jgi:hypothetical protein